ncbi:RHS repeat-associated core domain-containing protein [Dawidia soli]|uniref:RHS repeat-associated core domain-containing protein n=1 Tax=Dawidia soli TaxID=2782352 RepID=A0AAP2GJ89_9BACT|nr:RHS repeat-associated core domain-containing protein [Dawidia soli]MBT1689151.1 RHS repeat-associated core domain-containing protein [Dawidia soli]
MGNNGGPLVDGGSPGSLGGSAFPFPTFFNHQNEPGTGPKAYLNYLIFDRDFNYLDGGFERLTADGRETGALLPEGSGFDELSFAEGDIKIMEPGFVYIYFSNENDNRVEVFFDDFTVTHTKSPVVQVDDYYPYGLTFNSYQRENGLSQKYLFNGKEFLDEMNIDWHDYQARQYDSKIGRFLSVDPATEAMRKFSVYSYAFGNPIRFIDPDGMMPEEVIDPTKQKNEKNIQQKVDRVYEQPLRNTPLPGQGASVELSGSVSIGLQGGFSVKVLGENMSVFVNFGSFDLVTASTSEGVKSGDGNVKEGAELGIGPVGVSKEIETSKEGENGNFTVTSTEKTTFNFFNIEGSGTSQTDVKNPESTNPQTTRMTSTSLGASQSAKAGLGIVISGGVSGSITPGRVTGVGDLNPKYVASDATRVSINKLPPKK